MTEIDKIKKAFEKWTAEEQEFAYTFRLDSHAKYCFVGYKSGQATTTSPPPTLALPESP